MVNMRLILGVCGMPFQFKSLSDRYKDISVDLRSLLDDAVERYGRYDVQNKDVQGKTNGVADEDMLSEGEELDEDGDDQEDMVRPSPWASEQFAG